VQQLVPISRGALVKIVFAQLIIAILVLFSMLFLPVGTFAYWEAWVHLSIN
jgi:hypothetical protein